jgi:hypothetical protein
MKPEVKDLISDMEVAKAAMDPAMRAAFVLEMEEVDALAEAARRAPPGARKRHLLRKMLERLELVTARYGLHLLQPNDRH